MKHNGNILIEQLGKTTSSSGRSGGGQSDRRSKLPQTLPINNTQTSSNTYTRVSSQANQGPTFVLEDLLKRSLEQHQQQQKIDVANNDKKYKCQFCPYESNSKSQLQYHTSFHNQRTLLTEDVGEVFHCKYCTYTVSRRHLLLQHLKMHGPDAVDDAVDLTAEDHVEKSKVTQEQHQPQTITRLLYYCRHCPARYLSKQEIDTHISMHSGEFSYKCKICSYTATAESNMQAHITVHSTYYQEKTKEFQRKYQASPDYPMPRIEPTEQPSTSSNDSTYEQYWIVVAPPPLPQALLKTLHDQKMFSLLSLLTKCKFCPYNAENPDDLQLHLVHHKRFSGQEFSSKCEHCDYSANTALQLAEHLKLHFEFIQKCRSDLITQQSGAISGGDIGKSMAFYTNYDKLELKCMDLSKVKKEVDIELDKPESVYSEDESIAAKYRKIQMISNVPDNEKIVVRLD